MTAPIEPEHLHPVDRQGEETKPAGCPRDTDGDGDCGQPACPDCGRYRKMQERTEGTPRPQSWGVENY